MRVSRRMDDFKGVLVFGGTHVVVSIAVVQRSVGEGVASNPTNVDVITLYESWFIGSETRF